MQNRRIVLCISSLSPGGAERIISTIANYLVRINYDVMILLQYPKSSSFYEVDERIWINSIEMGKPSSNLIVSLASNIRRIFKMRKVIHNFNPSAVISFIDKNNILVTLAMLGSKIKVVISERNDPSQYMISEPWNMIRPLVYRCANIVTAQSSSVANFMKMEWNLNKVEIIPNSLPENLPPPNPNVERGNICLAVGRLVPQKDHDFMLRAWQAIHQKNPNWRLKIIGEGFLKEELNLKVEELGLTRSVIFDGLAKNIWEEYQKAKVFILTSKYEGFPNALMEALAFGCACVSINCPSGPSELITNEVNGVLIEPGNLNDFVVELDKMLNSDVLQQKYSAASILIRERYSVDKIILEWINLIR
jgi:GalNAc-alpha-(1->4)-GalNAc-alpha-(1->3)-diNAcBac-PP-undecaprenol alpha-1,4-N-acetyl-D-galactosaminyltransferase